MYSYDSKNKDFVWFPKEQQEHFFFVKRVLCALCEALMQTRQKRNILKLRYRHVKRKIWRVLSKGRHQRQYYTKYWKTRRVEYWISLDDVFWARMEGYL